MAETIPARLAASKIAPTPELKAQWRDLFDSDHKRSLIRAYTKTVTGTRLPCAWRAACRRGKLAAAVIDQLRAVFRQPETVAGTRKAARPDVDAITEADARAALQRLKRLADERLTAEQASSVALLVGHIDIGTDGLTVRLRGDRPGDLAREMLAGDEGAAARPAGRRSPRR